MMASPVWLLCGCWLLFACERVPADGPASASSPAVREAAPPTAHESPAPPTAHESPAPPLKDTSPRAVESVPPAPAPAGGVAPSQPAGAVKTIGIVEVKREGQTATLHAVRAARAEGFDRVVFEFREHVPGYHLEYIDKPVVDCGAGDVKPIEGDGWLEVRFYPADAHTEAGEPTVRERELKPALRIVREIERTCDFEAVVTWVIGTASPNRYRAFELASPPRLVVDIDH
jgi:hypothetical protein